MGQLNTPWMYALLIIIPKYSSIALKLQFLLLFFEFLHLYLHKLKCFWILHVSTPNYSSIYFLLLLMTKHGLHATQLSIGSAEMIELLEEEVIFEREGEDFQDKRGVEFQKIKNYLSHICVKNLYHATLCTWLVKSNV